MTSVEELVAALKGAEVQDLVIVNRSMVAAAGDSGKGGQPLCAACFDAIARLAAEELVNRLLEKAPAAPDKKAPGKTIAVPPGARIQ